MLFRSAERGLVGRIQAAVAQLQEVGIPLNASQTLMFLSVNGLKKQLLGENQLNQVWADKTRHWFPVPWAYAAHIYTQEVLNLFGFNLQLGDQGFYHEATHGFVVPGKFFQDNLVNHGGPDLDDTVKVHIRNIVHRDGSVRKMAFLLRNPNDFGEWSMIPIKQDGPVFHTYGEIPTVEMDELEFKVPQFSKLREQLRIGELPCMVNKIKLSDEFSLEDEARSRLASQAFPAGVGGTVIPKMMWYANVPHLMMELAAPNEDIIDALQQGQASMEDVMLIDQWISGTFRTLGQMMEYEMDAFWYMSRMPSSVHGWRSGNPKESPWVDLQIGRAHV